ncbi:bifunctional 4-hydroxy-2-oxoglutarate aldolase/2-dehydro-3-deoxy-phosphogluconate aldolase [Colwellia sp. MB02u-18]|uniref:bifunctional 4-hydroxy-2-oxoglutarate aldolase/2-dehydro-3-deoxy-phosphogluconate aldolase n=1 Tax=unclassified Colwellia TaxID=196834 RepID=UPI0015F4EA70|nr:MULTISPECIES: bifunctional 4-hydroxy-2-oxoglutarate aldolase/2-dehydro-3-deoxy-phosphogluconate aldolase [unclassified Colwellia]MBA6222654.1 bifunctional 4-hydroxy-2-oxoglutarate aldolase/2-dehydro-3-deoxy-phosphogluconate aldolase [Colwellia sp. MB3u-45]MBA6269158.1 bifunctional 4-hydroxy-2-oxoglutarate aldolase/2-dehydro-3-deoxy-phosphogluconate aldolase [Colwellia sp. MB3u-43]MBA6322787.1 bifunctional 4-hydroxy-2-oxoglutarate aldolase/2-dehydro-3-deoxy-phosphogluconate aldolase [Colwellia
MKLFSTLLAEQKLLPIIQADTVEQGINIAGAMHDAGITLVEVVLRTENSLSALSAIKQKFPLLQVGAGTIVNKEILSKSLDAGADFIVTPAISNTLLNHLSTCPVPVLPGVSNTADILLAMEYGFTEQKLFPASLSGGKKFLSAVSSVFKNISFCPTGGINAENSNDYLSLNNVFAVGGTWMSKQEWIQDKQWHLITQACKDFNQ